MKILMLKGLPGSGKSTWAKEFVATEDNWVRVNKDDIRAMIGYRISREKLVVDAERTLVGNFLRANKNVVIDNTGFNPVHQMFYEELAKIHGAGFAVKEFNTPLDECIENDLKRLNSVGEKDIKRMHEKYVRPAIAKEYQKNPYLPKAVICDLDGTLALLNGRNPYDASTCDKDLVNMPVAEAVWKYARDGYEILFTSGRESCYREQTVQFLKQLNFPRYQLFMRATSDHRKDHVVKLELFQRHIHGYYDVEVVFDDRQRVVDMWRDVGLPVFQVADGNF